MREIDMVEFEDICKKNGSTKFSVTFESLDGEYCSTVLNLISCNFTIVFDSISFYADTLTLRKDNEYMRVYNVKSVKVDDSMPDWRTLFYVETEELAHIDGKNGFLIEARP